MRVCRKDKPKLKSPLKPDAKSQQARVAVLSGPYSDNYGPALSAIADAKAKLQAGDTNVMEQLHTADVQIRAAQDWSRRFLGQTHEDTR